jgi:TonB-dependent SusC/RagA subfamily outer membrane receptor
MKNKIFISLIFLAILLVSTNLYAQERIVHGKVTTFENIPLTDVSVEVKSTKQVVLTDSLGNFIVSCDKKDKLKVFAHGFNKQNVKLKGRTKFVAINLHLKSNDEKGKFYAVGYGHVSDVNKLNAVTNLNNNELDFSKYKDIYDLIKGRFSGVRIVDGDVIVRGNNTFGSQTTNAALIVVDGIPSNRSALSNIPPEDVKSIDIIKDGGSAIYGSQGANGVVIIETRHGSDNRNK